MSRVFWDAMLFIYVVEGNRKFAPLVERSLSRSLRRKDVLITSHLSLAETLVGLEPSDPRVDALISMLNEAGFLFVGFDERAVQPFVELRRQHRLKAPDSMHLACAAACGTDLFLTGDKDLLRKRLHIPGIQFIADFENPPL